MAISEHRPAPARPWATRLALLVVVLALAALLGYLGLRVAEAMSVTELGVTG